MSAIDSLYRFRAELVSDVERDLMGPETEDEVIYDAPITKYLVGILYPQAPDAVDPSAIADEVEDGDDVTQPDPAVALAHMRYPSSMGLSFAVDPSIAAIVAVTVTAARYEQIDASDEARLSAPVRGRHRAGTDQPWRRIPLAASLNVHVNSEDAGSRYPLADGLSLFVRTRLVQTRMAVTLVLINDQVAHVGSTEKDASSFFQVRLRASSIEMAQSGFVERSAAATNTSDPDLRSYSLLYRHARTFAIGHGCSARWSIGQGHRDYVETTHIPTFELPLAVSNPAIDLECLDLAFLSAGERGNVVASLGELPHAYRKWISEQRALPIRGGHASIAEEHLSDCSEAAERMENAITLLRTDTQAWEAFRLANRAMLTVRSRADWHRNGRPADGPIEQGQRWYPFQLGFLLLSLAGIVAPGNSDRDVVDLLWFPTGGGKTEAYLGLIAFTIFLRRLRRGDAGAGVTALMRYTLRLLTIQQFERAAALIVTCEGLRREAAKLGAEAISLGLWVGSDGTPNRREDAHKALKQLRAGGVIEKGNPVQLKACPWCGTALDADNYVLAKPPRIAISCPNANCPFRTGLPVHVVDDDVYEFHPTLVIATVDKFAGIAWRESAHQLFNLDLADTPPPELVVQDELHLISGPLGTLNGLYEAAIDGATTTAGVRSKVVASTATIRRAQTQSRALFARKVRQFPPPGLDARDSFFAVDADPQSKGTRLYVGVLSPGTSHTTLMVRVYARLLQTAADIAAPDNVRDPYWTLLGYFNSLRVLSGARMQVHNDVVDRVRLLESDDRARREPDRVIELTSREASADIPGYLRNLAVPYPDGLDVVLATNMISVGVDIDRLGLMAVMGQPQGTAEYIQATSRVGRRYPGLVFVLLNNGRSRDRSHFEAFASYHAALYRQVESSSVTPFSPRARDRALHAALVASVRLRIPTLRANDSAASIGKHSALVEPIVAELVARAEYVAGHDEAENVRSELSSILERWRARALEVPNLKYWDKDPGKSLLVDAAVASEAEVEAGDEVFGTLWSLRDVDRSSNLFLLR